MDYKKVEKCFLLGGAVKYQGKLFNIVGMNELNHTFTIKRESEQLTVTNVKVDKLEKE